MSEPATSSTSGSGRQPGRDASAGLGLAAQEVDDQHGDCRHPEAEQLQSRKDRMEADFVLSAFRRYWGEIEYQVRLVDAIIFDDEEIVNCVPSVVPERTGIISSTNKTNLVRSEDILWHHTSALRRNCRDWKRYRT